MSNTNNIEALTTIINALKDLDADSQKRTINAVSTFLGLNLTLNDQPLTQASEERSHKTEEFSFSTNKNLSAKEFLRDKMPTTDVERIACLAYYLTHYREVPHFKTLDLSFLNVEAAQPKFSNAAQAVENATKAGFLVQATKGSKQLSSMGEIFVQNLPNRDVAKEAIAHLRVKKRFKKATKSK